MAHAYDLFMSHASEDKEGFVRELVESLRARGLSVWFDEAELQVGDTLTRKIDEGLAQSRFGVVVLSEHFFAKHWPRAELDALATREIESDEVVILPIWLDVTKEQVAEYSPLLAKKLALHSELGVEEIANRLERRVRGRAGEPVAETTDAPVSTTLQPELLRGRVFPYMWSPVVRSDERALVLRVALAAPVPATPERRFRSDDQDAFEQMLDDSLLESYLHQMTYPLPRRKDQRSWHLIEPSKSWILTAERPATKMIPTDWTMSGQAAVSLRPWQSVGPPGWLILVLDAVIRPANDAAPTPDSNEWTPLNLNELSELLFVLLTSLLDEVGPQIRARVGGGPPLAVSALVLPSGDELTRYVALENYARSRVMGATGPHAIDWHPSSMDEVATPDARFASIRDRIEDLFADGGYRGYENEVARLEIPRIAK